jgi:hypothetical protein
MTSAAMTANISLWVKKNDVIDILNNVSMYLTF